jgi:molybdopterin-binding protein
VQTRRDARNRRLISIEEVQRLRGAPERGPVGGRLSARNRLPGRVVSVQMGDVMALVEIASGPHVITAAVTHDAVEELGLSEGRQVYARIQATDVMVELDDRATSDPGAATP